MHSLQKRKRYGQMIEQVIVTDRGSVEALIKELKQNGKKVIWITISDDQRSALRKGGGKDILVLHFHDIEAQKSYSFTRNKARKVKNFIFNHHLNSKEVVTLVVNCRAGVSRSTAVGKFAEIALKIPARFTELESKRMIAPNRLVLKLLGLVEEARHDTLTQYHEEFGYDNYTQVRGFL